MAPVTTVFTNSLDSPENMATDPVANRHRPALKLKLGKAGCRTEALVLAHQAKSMEFGVMAGCNIGISLAMIPGIVIAQSASFADLDGPLLLAKDGQPGLLYDGSLTEPPEPALWG